ILSSPLPVKAGVSKASTSDTSVPPQEVYRLVLLGDPGVGKSSLASAFACVLSAGGCEGGDGEVYTRRMAVDGVDALVLVSVGRTQVQETSFEECCPHGDAFLLVYSVADRASFDAASERRIHLRRARPTHQDPPVIFVGNKSDLVRCRAVSEEGMACAVVFGCKFIETSAPLQLHVVDLFVGAVRQVRLHRAVIGATVGPPPVTGNRASRRTVNRRESFSAKARRVLVGLAGGIAGGDGQEDAFQAKSKSCHDLSVL
uniref:GTP binding protein overexpressed in skeletal muscle n=1 Tax=Eptatretus burgeri TaxID=7764 RepID=A0A8C4WX96_EPTBU